MNLLTKLSFSISPAILVTSAILFSAGPAAHADSFSNVATVLANAISSAPVEAMSLQAEQEALKAEAVPSDPEVEFDYLWPSVAGETNRWSGGISQEIPDFRKRRSISKTVDALSEQADIQKMAEMSESYYQASLKLIEYISVRREHALLHKIHENFDSLSINYNRAWDRGEATLLDLNKIRIEHAKASSADLEVDGRMAALTKEIIALSRGKITAASLATLEDYPYYQVVNDLVIKAGGARKSQSSDCNEETHTTDALTNNTIATPDAIEEAVRKSPQYALLEAKLKVSQARVNLASMSRFPKLTLGYVHNFEDNTHFNGVSAGLTLPVWSRGAEKSAAVAAAMAQDIENEKALNEMTASVKSDYALVFSLKQRLNVIGPAIENADNIRLLKMALTGGEISLLDYLQEVAYFMEAALEYNSIRADYCRTAASLMRYLQ